MASIEVLGISQPTQQLNYTASKIMQWSAVLKVALSNCYNGRCLKKVGLCSGEEYIAAKIILIALFTCEQ